MSKNVLLVHDNMIKERTVVHGNIDPKLIYPDIKAAQDMYIHPILGSALYLKLQSIVEDGSIFSNSDLANYKTLLDMYIVDALIYYTLAELPMTLSFQFWNKGIVRKQGSDSELPSMSDIVDVSEKYKNRGEFYAQRLRLYLKQNASKMFPEYLEPGCGFDAMHPEKSAFTNPIYLGDD